MNVSIKIYFRLNTLRLCKNLIRTVESRQFAALHAFPAAQRVTYKFYVRRLAVFDEQYVRCACWATGACHQDRHAGQREQVCAAVQPDAQACLEYALEHCHKQAKGNKALVLKYLVPVTCMRATHTLLCCCDVSPLSLQVQLLLGRLPLPALTANYGLQQYDPIISALCTGNVKLFNETMNNRQIRFIQQVLA